MSDGNSPYASIQHQKEIGRIRRRDAGADTTLDDAEVRADAIWNYVRITHIGGPFFVAILLGWIGRPEMVPWQISYGGACLTITVAGACGGMLDAMFGAFHPNIKIKTYNFWMTIGGICVLVLGLLSLSPGVIATAAALLASGLFWERWADHVMANTDYARLIAAREDPSPPRIVE